MNKIILCLTFLALGFLTIVSTIDPNASAVWLASSEQSFDMLRSGVMFVLLILMFTNPPRNIALRAIIGLSAAVLIGWSGYMTYQGMFQMLDGLVLLAAGIASLIAILEFEPIDEQIVSPNFKKPAQTS